MYLLLIRHVLLVVCMLATASVYGQGNPTGESWLPKQGPAEPPEFQRLAFVKASADQQGLTILMPSYESTTKVRQVSKTVFETEVRVRTVKSNGQDQTQEYTVVVPRVITETQEYIGADPDGRSTKHGVPLSKLSAWTMTGQEVSREELAKRFVTPTRAFVMESDPNKPFPGLDAYYASVYRPDTLVIYVAPGMLGVNAGPTAAVPAPAAAAPVPVPVPAAPTPASR